MPPLVPCLLAVLLTVGAFPPLDWGWLGFLAAWPWCWLARVSSGRRLLLWGYLSGAATLSIGCVWLKETHPASLIGMVLFEALYYGGLVVVLRRLILGRGWPAALALPVAWVAMEFGRRHVPLDGFPWLFLGYTQHGWLPFLQVADLGGVYLLSFLLAAVAGCLDDLPRAKSRSRQAVLASLGVLLLLVPWWYGTVRLGEEVAESDPSPRVLVVQANIPQELKGSAMHDAEVVRRHLDRTRAGVAQAGDEVDLIVWGETMVPVGVFGRGGDEEDRWFANRTARLAAEYRRQIVEELLVSQVLARTGAWILLGAVTHIGDIDRGDHRMFNSALLIDDEGKRRGLYDKRYLVPGGEYVPVVGSLPAVVQGWAHDFVASITGGWVPELEFGENSPVLIGDGSGETRWGASICYDVAYPEISREAVAEGAELLINISNEAWFDGSWEFEQYTAIAVCRCAELKRAMVRCANSGTSAGIDPYGRVQALVGPRGELDGFAGTLLLEPERRQDRTVYARWGDWVAWLSCAGTALLFLLRRRSGGQGPVTAPAPGR